MKFWMEFVLNGLKTRDVENWIYEDIKIFDLVQAKPPVGLYLMTYSNFNKIV